MTMTIEEIAKARSTLEEAIYDLLTEFKAKTGVTVGGIHIHMVEKYNAAGRRERLMDDVHLRCEL